MNIKLKFYSDPGHSWLAVKRSLLEQVMPLSEVTPYSYMKGKTVYLEEDVDAVRFLKRMAEQGYALSIDHRHTDQRSPIRSYDRVSSVASVA